jgi:hypothetical protein
MKGSTMIQISNHPSSGYPFFNVKREWEKYNSLYNSQAKKHGHYPVKFIDHLRWGNIVNVVEENQLCIL